MKNPKSQSATFRGGLNPKQIRNSKSEIPDLFEHLNLENSNLFRISNLGFSALLHNNSRTSVSLGIVCD